MADAARDLTLSLITDQSRFDTEEAARGLQDVGDAGGTAATGLGDAEEAAERASRGLSDLQTQAGQTGTALDGVGGSGSDAGAQVGDGLEDGASRGSEAFGDMRDEAGAALIELAGSFDGTMSGLLDTVQGAVPAIGAAFGPLGLVAGAAVGIGLGAARAQAERLQEAVSAMTSSLIADGGRLSRDSVLAKIEEFAADGSILDLADQARQAGVDVATYVRAMAGDSRAIDQTRAAIDEYNASIDRSLDSVTSAASAETGVVTERQRNNDAIDSVSAALADQEEIQRRAAEATDAYTAATGNGTAAVFRHNDALAEQQEVNQATSDSLGAVGTSAGQLAADVELSVDSILESLQRQADAQVSYATNLDALYNEMGQDAVDFVASQGENAAQVAQLLVDAPQERRGEIIDAYREVGRTSTAQYAAGITDGLAGVESSAGQIGTSSARALENAFTGQTGRVVAAAERLRAQVQEQLNKDFRINPNVLLPANANIVRYYS